MGPNTRTRYRKFNVERLRPEVHTVWACAHRAASTLATTAARLSASACAAPTRASASCCASCCASAAACVVVVGVERHVY
eukprot:scaffold80253_cov87-Phaeocystis_antarctica.AAC.2